MRVNEFKTAFSDLVYDIIRADVSDLDFMEFQNIMKMISILFCNKKERELFRILKLHFPEYYNHIKSTKVK